MDKFGLGLALVRTLVALRGGSASAKSAGLNQGSLFIVQLPHSQRQAARRAEPQALAVAAPEPSCRVLIVDDNVDVAHMLGLLLEEVSLPVEVAHDPQQALARAQQQPYRAFLLDIGLTDMNGNEFARQLRTTPAGSDATLIAITGYGGPQDRVRSLEAGFDHQLTKPAHPQKIIGLLQAMVHEPRG